MKLIILYLFIFGFNKALAKFYMAEIDFVWNNAGESLLDETQLRDLKKEFEECDHKYLIYKHETKTEDMTEVRQMLKQILQKYGLEEVSQAFDIFVKETEKRFKEKNNADEKERGNELLWFIGVYFITMVILILTNDNISKVIIYLAAAGFDAILSITTQQLVKQQLTGSVMFFAAICLVIVLCNAWILREQELNCATFSIFLNVLLLTGYYAYRAHFLYQGKADHHLRYFGSCFAFAVIAISCTFDCYKSVQELREKLKQQRSHNRRMSDIKRCQEQQEKLAAMREQQKQKKRGR